MLNLILSKKRIVKIILIGVLFYFSKIILANTVTIEGNTKIKDSQINVQEYQGNIYEKYDLVPIESLKLASYLPEILTDYEKFVNRSKELEEIEQAFAGNQVVVITGRGGMGKSSLAIEYGKYFKGDNKIVRHINSDATSKIDQTYQGLAKEFDINVTGQPPAMVMKLVYNKLSRLPQEILFIFDNVQQYDDIKNYVINLPANTKAIITTRQPRSIPDAPHIVLAEFNDEAAMEYLEYSLQNRLPSKNDIQEIIRNTSALPYDLKCNLAYLLDNPLTDSKKAILESGGKIKGKLFEEFAISTDKTKRQAWQILQYAAYLDPDFISMDILKELFPQNEKLLPNAIKKLESLSLISIVTDNEGQLGFRIHRKLQKSVQYSIKNHPKYAMNEREISSNLLTTLDNLFVEVERNPDIKWKITSKLQSHVKKLLDSTIQVVSDRAKISQANLYFKLAKYYARVNVNYKQALIYGHVSLNQRRSLFLGDDPAVANSLDIIGDFYKLSNVKKGLDYLIEGLKMRQRIYQGDHPDIATSLRNIGVAYRIAGELRKGLQYGEAALQMRQRLYPGNHHDTAESSYSVGLDYLYLRDLKASLKFLEASLKMFKAIYSGNHPDIALLLGGLAYCHYELGNYVESLEYAKASVTMNKALYPEGNPFTVYALRYLGAALIATNDIGKALNILHQALDISKEYNMDKHFMTAFVYRELGLGHFKQGDYKKALEYNEKALSLRQEIYANVKNHPEIILSLQSLGDIHFASGDKIKALKFYQEALTMSLALSLDHLPETKELQQKIEKCQNNK